jgi:uncharacterized membrane protein YkvA (DUF1232 family)
MKDNRVSLLVKILPFLSLLYLFFYPDFLPGPIDDAVVVTIFLQFFLALVPDEIVDELKYKQEHQQEKAADEDTIIEGEFWEE